MLHEQRRINRFQVKGNLVALWDGMELTVINGDGVVLFSERSQNSVNLGHHVFVVRDGSRFTGMNDKGEVLFEEVRANASFAE